VRKYNLPKESKMCERCGTVFYPSKANYLSSWKKRRFCSNKCVTQHSADSRRYLNPIKCAYCAQFFQPRIARNKFCSRACYWESKKGMPAPNVPPGSRVTLQCKMCEQPFSVTRHRAVKQGVKFCSAACYYQFVKCEHPNGLLAYTTNNKFYLSKEWSKLKRAVKKRDKYACQRCHKQFARSSNGMRVHHIIERSSFTNITDRLHIVADSQDNLITLCVSCHSKVHAGSSL